MSLLNSNYDLGGCLANCSNNGQCKLDSLINSFLCLCNSIYLSGSACQKDTRPCSSSPCLNNAACVDSLNSSFSCVCDEYHRGANCEFEIDLCQNETCSSNGNCFSLNNTAKCKCFNMYAGEKCESESNERKALKVVNSLTCIVAIIAIIVFYSCLILMDLAKVCCKKKISRKKLKRVEKKSSKKVNSKQK